jgi:predicted DsbA family dithiol-disulfide isomerase
MASLCAADQNAFWPMYRTIYQNQPFDGRENTGQFTNAFLRDLASQIGLDTQAFSQCLNSEAHKATLDQDGAEAKQYGIGQVPALVINGKLYDTARTAGDLRMIFAPGAPAVQLKP